MFKKLYEEIESLRMYIRDNFRFQSDAYYKTKDDICKETANICSKFDKMERVITSQQRTIEQLTNALMNKYKHGLFVVSEDCKVPMVIRNGKEIVNDRTTYFRITWAVGEAPLIETEQSVGTLVGED